MMHGQPSIKICITEEAKQLHQYKNNKLKLQKVNAAIWYNKTPEAACVIKHLILLMMDQLVRNM